MKRAYQRIVLRVFPFRAGQCNRGEGPSVLPGFMLCCNAVPLQFIPPRPMGSRVDRLPIYFLSLLALTDRPPRPIRITG